MDQTKKDWRFYEHRKFTIKVPTRYRHESQVDNFAKRVRGQKATELLSPSLTDANFSRVTDRLQAGKTYEVVFFLVQRDVSSDTCLAFLKSERALLVGAQGLTLVQGLEPGEFPPDSWVYSLDTKANLFPEEVREGRKKRYVYQTPWAQRRPSGLWSFGTWDFVEGHEQGDMLLCVRELSPS